MRSQSKAPRISGAEREVLEILWQDPPHPSSELVRRLAPRGWSETTVKTLVSRLVKKGVAAFEQEGNRYFYRPLVTREECLADEFALVARFVETTPLTAGQIAELKKILEGKPHGSL